MNTQAHKELTKFATLSECKRFIFLTNQKQPHCRPGQALCNQYNIDEKIELKIYEQSDLEQVALIVFQHYRLKRII